MEISSKTLVFSLFFSWLHLPVPALLLVVAGVMSASLAIAEEYLNDRSLISGHIEAHPLKYSFGCGYLFLGRMEAMRGGPSSW
jgi:hypothetical protein